MPSPTNRYAPLIRELEAETRELEQRAQDNRLIIAKLAARSRGTPNGGRAKATQPRPSSGKRGKRGATSEMILETVRRNPGQPAGAYIAQLKSRIQQVSNADDPAKLVHSTLSYLLSQKRVRRDAAGKYSPATDK